VPTQKKKAEKAPEKPQGQRFIDFAREHGADDPTALDRAIGQIANPDEQKKPKS
jgi:hypothetical protein